MHALGAVVTDDPDSALAGAEVAIDFTRPAASLIHARACAAAGLSARHRHHRARRIRHAASLTAVARSLAVILAPNMSVGVNVLFRLAELAARALPEQLRRRDLRGASSGQGRCAVAARRSRSARRVAAARGTAARRFGGLRAAGRHRPRPAGAIGFSVLRGGDIVGEHDWCSLVPAKRVELAHRRRTARICARRARRGPLAAAGRKPGLYGMHDVLGL